MAVGRHLAGAFVAAIPLFCFALTHCSVTLAGDAPDGASDSPVDSVDGSPLEPTCPRDDAGAVLDQCRCATSSPLLDSECSPDKACPDELDCIYEPGCTNPRGQCRPYARCTDGGLLSPSICGCDGVVRRTRGVPFPALPAPGTHSAPCPGDGGTD